MAQFGGEGFDDLVDNLRDMQELFGEAADDVLNAGAAVVSDCWKQAAEEHGLRDTGDMIASIKPDKIKDTGGVKSIDVYPQGKDQKGTRNAEKAYVNHYGSSKIKATHFVTDAINQAEESAVDAMENAWNNRLDNE